MRILYRASVVMTLAFLMFFTFSCGSDSGGSSGGGGGVVLGPEVFLNTGAELTSFNQTFPADTAFFLVSVTGNDGDNPLRSLTILEDGLTIPADRLTFRTGEVSNNPILTAGSDADGFTYEIEIEPAGNVTGDVNYEFRVTDTDNRTATTNLIITYEENRPEAELLIGDGLVSNDVTLNGGSFDVRLQLSTGDALLQSLEVLENGALLNSDYIMFANGVDFFNPLSFVANEMNGVTFDLRLTPTFNAGETKTYTFRVTDEDGVTGETSVNVTFPNADLSFNMTGIFFNASGSENGGLDLDTGNSVAFNADDAEIQDEGVNLDANGENWRTQVSSVNDAVLKVANLSAFSDGLTFDDVQVVSQIEAIFDHSSSVIPSGNDNFPNTDGDTSNTEDVTEPLQEGDVLVVRRGDRTYLVRIDEINFVANSNDDNYKVSIKY